MRIFLPPFSTEMRSDFCACMCKETLSRTRAMAETIRQLRAARLDCCTCVGGAVVTQEYADEIGADCYAKEAMDTVRYADRVFGS